jgi:hypothetical protein
MDEARVIAYCAECGSEITEEDEEAYVDEDGNYFDSVECVLEYHKIKKIEL